jgi:flagella basal body P-ring formation protein FlgA
MRLALCFWLLTGPALAETVVATRTIRPQEILAPADLILQPVVVPGGVSDPDLLIGQEARVALYAGRPVRAGDVGPPALVERNSLVSLIYSTSGLRISTEGRALDRAGPGEMVRVMNLASRTTVSARIGPDGAAYVSF